MKKKATIIGVPMDLGASKKGASGGPAAIRRANILPALDGIGVGVLDAGDVPIPAPAAGGTFAGSAAGHAKIKRAAAILKICKDVEKAVYETAKAGRVPIVLGGDHSLAMGSVSGVARVAREDGGKIGLIWVDAHADINTPDTSPSGNIHGMPLAHLLGMGDKTFSRVGGFAPKAEARNVCLVGVRDVDKGEAANIRKSGVHVFSMKEVDRFGLGVIMEQAIDIASDNTDGFYVSFDIDAVDPSGAPGTGVPKRGGLTYRESHLLMELAADSEKLLGLDLVEVNPLEDTHNATAELAVELISSAMGKSIY